MVFLIHTVSTNFTLRWRLSNTWYNSFAVYSKTILCGTLTELNSSFPALLNIGREVPSLRTRTERGDPYRGFWALWPYCASLMLRMCGYLFPQPVQLGIHVVMCELGGKFRNKFSIQGDRIRTVQCAAVVVVVTQVCYWIYLFWNQHQSDIYTCYVFWNLCYKENRNFACHIHGTNYISNSITWYKLQPSCDNYYDYTENRSMCK